MKLLPKIVELAVLAGVLGAAIGLPGMWRHWFADDRPVVNLPAAPEPVHRSLDELRKPLLEVFQISCGTMGENEDAEYKRNCDVLETTHEDDLPKAMIVLTRSGEPSSWAVSTMLEWQERRHLPTDEYRAAMREWEAKHDPDSP